MKTSSAKAKGRKLQKFVMDLIVDFVPGVERGDAISRSMGCGGVDIILSPKAQKLFPFSIECKNTKAFPGLRTLKQAEANCYEGTLPCFVWHPHGYKMEGSVISFRCRDFVKFWGEQIQEIENAKK